MSQSVIVTNNDKVFKKYKGKKEILFLEEGSYLAVLEKSRDLVHRGAKLLSHPMAGSMKPNQTPYRSVLLEQERLNETYGKESVSLPDMESLRLIENSIEAAKKFLAIKGTPQWPSQIKEDFKTVDLSIMDSAIK